MMRQQLLTGRVIAGAEGNPGATVVHNGCFTRNLCQSLMMVHAVNEAYWDLSKLPEGENPCPDKGPYPIRSTAYWFNELNLDYGYGEGKLIEDEMFVMESESNICDLSKEYEFFFTYFTANGPSPAWIKDFEPPAEWDARYKIAFPDEEEEEFGDEEG